MSQKNFRQKKQTVIRGKVSRAGSSYQDVDDSYALVDVIVSSGAFVERDRRDPISGRREPFMRGLEITPEAIRLDRMKSGAPVLDNHQDDGDIDAVIGSVDDVWFEEGVDGQLLMARLKISKISAREKEIANKIKNGIITAVSVGADIHRDIDITQDGDEMTKLLSVDWEPYEVSLVPIPADELSIIRSRPTKEAAMPKATRKTQIKRMDGDVVKEVVEDIVEEVVEDGDVAKEVTEEILTEVMADATDKEEQAEGTDKEEYMGEDDEKLMGESDEKLMDEADKEKQAENEDEDKEEMAKLIRKLAIRKLKSKVAKMESTKRSLKSRRSRVVVDESRRVNYAKESRQKIQEAMTSKVLRKFVKADEPNEFKHLSFVEIGREALYRDGQTEARHWPAGRVYDELLGSGRRERRSSGPFHVTSDFNNLFTSSVNKAVLESYDAQRGKQTFAPFVTKTQVNDFKTQERVSLGEFGKLQETAPGVDAPITSMKDTKEEYKIKTYSNTFQITRQGFIDDDTGQLQQVLTSGMSAADLESDLVYDEIASGMVGGSTWASTGRKNLTQSAALNATTSPYKGIKGIYEGLAKQTGLDVDTPLGLTFEYLLVPTALYFEALQTQGVAYPATSAAPNPYASLYKVIHEPRLDGKANGTTTYYGIAAEAGTFRTFIELAFLKGQSTPIMKYEESFSNDVLKWKLTHDVAAKMLDYRLAHKVTA